MLQFSGIRILDGPMTDSLEAMAFNTKMEINDVYSCRFVISFLSVVRTVKRGLKIMSCRVNEQHSLLFNTIFYELVLCHFSYYYCWS